MRESLKRVHTLLNEELVQRGYFTRQPPGTRAAWSSAGVVLWLLAVATLLTGMVAASPFVWPLLASIALVALGAAAFVVSQHMPQKTRAGAEAAARWRAFRRSMEEVNRVAAQPGGQARFERDLPYAVAVGLERPWIDAFAYAEATAAPAWYDLVNLDGAWLRAGGRVARGGSLAGPNLPDLGSLQDVSSLATTSLQASSSTLFDLFNEVGEAFRLEPPRPSTPRVRRSVSGADVALRIGLAVASIARGGKGRGSGGGGGGFS